MSARLCAGAAGVLLITVAVLVFSLSRHPVPAGNNRIEPLYDTVFLPERGKYCQQLPTVPQGATRIRIRVSRTAGRPRLLEAGIIKAKQRIIGARTSNIATGDLTIPLERPTPSRPMTHAALCFSNPGRGEIVLAGETKRCTARDRGIGPSAPCIHPLNFPPGEKYRWLAGVSFLKSGSTSWLSRADVIVDRFRLGQAGLFGSWALWLAVVLSSVAAALGLWWVVRATGS